MEENKDRTGPAVHTSRVAQLEVCSRAGSISMIKACMNKGRFDVDVRACIRASSSHVNRIRQAFFILRYAADYNICASLLRSLARFAHIEGKEGREL
jgi:hypothetical protein